MPDYIVNSIPVTAESPKEAARSIYPNATLNGSLTEKGVSIATTWRTVDGEFFLVEELEG